MRSVVDRQLRALGCEVIAVSTGREAISVVELGTRVDVLLTDLDLPDLDGALVARAVASAAPGTRVVIMSGGAATISPLPSDATFLPKPFSHAALAVAVKAR